VEEVARELERARRLERGLVLVRWFGVVLGVYLVSQTNSATPPFASDRVITLAYAIMASLALGNLVISIAASRASSLEGIRKLGVAAFFFDTLITFALTWAFSYDPRGATWVVLYILPLEGALRYQLGGAMAAVALTLINEVVREAYLAARFPQPLPGQFIPEYNFKVANVAFRVGVQAIIALVAGFMARSLAREADRASRQAGLFEDAARAESVARREVAAFNTAILTGVAAEDLDTSLRLMAGAIGRDLEFETFSILLREDDDLVVKGMYGMPLYDGRIPLGQGVTGTVAVTGRPLIVPDVKEFPGYIMADPDVRSEMAAPLHIGDEVIGVIDVESRRENAFDQPSLESLTRLADQIALVAHSNRLLSQQRDTMQRLRELDQMKSDFISITSHELRTPLTAIRGFVKTLIRNRSRISEEQEMEFMAIIDRHSERLSRLVDDLLLVSRIESGTIQLRVERVNLATFLEETVRSFGPDHQSRIHVEVDGHPGPVMLDPLRVDQILRNLVGNALKFSTPESPVSVAASAVDGRLRLSIADRGVGIPAKELPNIFDRFHQAGPVLTREAEGAGLGLYITKRLVEAMGGSIEVSSKPGEGSTFLVDLPLTAAAPGALDRGSANSAQAREDAAG
jgi:signal transduction histidine kinase/MFS family permease